ncbi:uncharacterized protein V1518DRAFT_414662 [Limtongia smithiae]|uniref:uncharacterized protein n=1 Tax=Limtongia smithiae TaxID=1125753 RepID=UPI0034CE0B81
MDDNNSKFDDFVLHSAASEQQPPQQQQPPLAQQPPQQHEQDLQQLTEQQKTQEQEQPVYVYYTDAAAPDGHYYMAGSPAPSQSYENYMAHMQSTMYGVQPQLSHADAVMPQSQQYFYYAPAQLPQPQEAQQDLQPQVQPHIPPLYAYPDAQQQYTTGNYAPQHVYVTPNYQYDLTSLGSPLQSNAGLPATAPESNTQQQYPPNSNQPHEQPTTSTAYSFSINAPISNVPPTTASLAALGITQQQIMTQQQLGPTVVPKPEKKKRAAAVGDKLPAKKRATGSNNVMESTAITMSLPSAASPIAEVAVVPEVPKEPPIMSETDPVTALRIRVATAFKEMLDDRGALIDRLVEIMLCIPEEGYGSKEAKSKKMDLRDTFVMQVTSSTGSTNRDIWRGLGDSVKALARIRNWLAFDYKSKRYDDAKGVMAGLLKMSPTIDRLDVTKMTKVLTFFATKATGPSSEYAKRILERAKRSPEHEASPTAGSDDDAKKPSRAALAGFIIPKRTVSKATGVAGTMNTTAEKTAAAKATTAPIKQERSSGNSSFFQSLQRRSSTTTTRSASGESSSSSSSSSAIASAKPTPAPAAPVPAAPAAAAPPPVAPQRISSLITTLRSQRKEEDSSDRSTPEPPTKGKKVRKTVTWRSDADLEQIRYFKSDPQERSMPSEGAANSKMSARELDISEGRGAFKIGHQLMEDLEQPEEEERMPWYLPIELDFARSERFSPRERETNFYKRGGSKMAVSAEAETQKRREATVLMTIYFGDGEPSPSEPESEVDKGELEDLDSVKEIPAPQELRIGWMVALASQSSVAEAAGGAGSITAGGSRNARRKQRRATAQAQAQAQAQSEAQAMQAQQSRVGQAAGMLAPSVNVQALQALQALFASSAQSAPTAVVPAAVPTAAQGGGDLSALAAAMQAALEAGRGRK